jgi:hypothetical protein
MIVEITTRELELKGYRWLNLLHSSSSVILYPLGDSVSRTISEFEADVRPELVGWQVRV